MAIQEATEIRLAADERAALTAWARAATSEQRLAERARIVLLAGEGRASRAIARELGCAHRTVSKWRVRFAEDRLAGLGDAPRSGKPKTYDEAADRRILALLDRSPPQGFARWTAPLIAKELGDVSDQYVWRFLRAQRIDLAGRKSRCLSTDPEFAAKAPLMAAAGAAEPCGPTGPDQGLAALLVRPEPGEKRRQVTWQIVRQHHAPPSNTASLPRSPRPSSLNVVES